MTVTQLLQSDNVYRAIGMECWYSTTYTDRIDDKNVAVKPDTRKVVIEGRGDFGVIVRTKSGDRLCDASPDHLHDDKAAAMSHAIRQCESLDGKCVMGQFTYRYAKPAAKPEVVEYRAKPFTTKSWRVEYRVGGKGRWHSIIGLFNLTRWKANDCVKRLHRGDDIPGFWRVPGAWEFIELCDYEM